MKKLTCRLCGGSWIVEDSDLQRQKVCPYCAGVLEKKIRLTEYDTLGKAIYGAVTEVGEEVLSNPRQLSACIMDMAPELRRETRIFSRTINETYVREIQTLCTCELPARQVAVNRLHYRFVEDEGLSESWADLLCTGFQEAVRYLHGEGLQQEFLAEVTPFLVTAPPAVQPHGNLCPVCGYSTSGKRSRCPICQAPYAKPVKIYNV